MPRDHGSAILRRLGQPGKPTLQSQSVDDKELRVGEKPSLLGGRLEHMDVGIGADQARHRDVAAADFIHEIAQNAERDHDPDWRRDRSGMLVRPEKDEAEGGEPSGTKTREDHVISYHEMKAVLREELATG